MRSTKDLLKERDELVSKIALILNEIEEGKIKIKL